MRKKKDLVGTRKDEKDEMGLKRERKRGIKRDTQLIGGNRRNIEKE